MIKVVMVHFVTPVMCNVCHLFVMQCNAGRLEQFLFEEVHFIAVIIVDTVVFFLLMIMQGKFTR